MTTILRAATPGCRAALLIVTSLAAAGLPRIAGAQADTTTSCDGLIVSAVDVRTERPEFHGALAWWRKAAHAMGLHHETTARGVVRRFVTLEPGQRCTEFRRAESERILRAQPYLAGAHVTTTRHGDSVRVSVETVDEVPAILGARLRGISVRALSLGSLNFVGTGTRLEGKWEEGGVNRDGVGGRFAHSQFLGHPYMLLLEGERRPIGEYYTTAISHAFLTDLQRVAWHAGYSTAKDFARLRMPPPDRRTMLAPVDRAMWDVGGVLRVGPPRRLALIGGMLLGERVVPRREFALVDSTTGALSPATDTAGIRDYGAYDVVNMAGVLGLRALTFTQMHGLDAIDADQDVGTGLQLATIFGLRPWSFVPLRDAFGSIDVYAGARTERSYVAVRAEAESRLDLERPDWRHLIASGRAAWYFRVGPRWMSEVSLEGAGGWKTIFPFQLELGDRRGGVRGYARSQEAGGRRLLLRAEQRADLARFQGTRAAIGAALFADAGRMWGGDVPFGRDTPVRTSVGAGLLLAVPANSRRTVRADIVIPLRRAEGARPELRFTVHEPARGFWSEPWRVRWARLSAVPEEIFSWP